MLQLKSELSTNTAFTTGLSKQTSQFAGVMDIFPFACSSVPQKNASCVSDEDGQSTPLIIIEAVGRMLHCPLLSKYVKVEFAVNDVFAPKPVAPGTRPVLRSITVTVFAGSFHS